MDTAKQLAEPKAWMRNGLCVDVDPELFFPTTKTRASYRLARDVCRGCAVVQTCLREALENEWGLPIGRRHGVWGATVPKERLHIETKIRHAKGIPPVEE